MRKKNKLIIKYKNNVLQMADCQAAEPMKLPVYRQFLISNTGVIIRKCSTIKYL